MAKIAHPMKLVVGAVTLFLVSFACMEKTLAQPSAGAPVGETKKPEAEATLFPVPDFTSDIWKRAKLTGDWGGAA